MEKFIVFLTDRALSQGFKFYETKNNCWLIHDRSDQTHCKFEKIFTLKYQLALK